MKTRPVRIASLDKKHGFLKSIVKNQIDRLGLCNNYIVHVGIAGMNITSRWREGKQSIAEGSEERMMKKWRMRKRENRRIHVHIIICTFLRTSVEEV